MKFPPRAGRSRPGNRPRARTEAAMAAPVGPTVTMASALPSLMRAVATATEARGFARKARTGCSPSAITPSQGTISRDRPSTSYFASSSWSAPGSPTSRTRTSLWRTASTAPLTGSAGAKSPPMASRAMVQNVLLCAAIAPRRRAVLSLQPGGQRTPASPMMTSCPDWFRQATS